MQFHCFLDGYLGGVCPHDLDDALGGGDANLTGFIVQTDIDDRLQTEAPARRLQEGRLDCLDEDVLAQTLLAQDLLHAR